MDVYESRQNRKRRARERHIARQNRRTGGMARAREEGSASAVRLPAEAGPFLARAGLILRDLGWYVLHKPEVTKAVGVIFGVLFILFVATHVFAGRIFPNVWALGVYVGDLTVEEAENALTTAWNNQIEIDLMLEGEKTLSVRPSKMGFQLDAHQTAENARSVGMAGIPLGYGAAPVITVDYLTLQNYLLDLMQTVDIPPYNAGYEWRDGQLVGVNGRDGRTLDVELTLKRINENPAKVIHDRKLELLMLPVPPDVIDPSPYLETARALASQPVQLTGYDPFTDRTVVWSASKEDFASWLEAGAAGLTLRQEKFVPFVRALDATLNTSDQLRYIDPEEATKELTEAIANKRPSVMLRVRYRPTVYTVQAGDTGYKIARTTGIPFYLIQQANPSRDLNVLSVGDSINLPARDLTLPEDPVPSKRIVVNLSTLKLTAYENGQQIFHWTISTGRSEAPTSPGIFQILTHNEVAIGSGAALCGNNGCGQWEMYWFMGIYEVIPGLINGFHGAVLLPNGAYLSGGNVGGRDTYGCIMSENNNAKALYDWAEIGTVVEIVSSEFPPQSDLGRLALSQSA